MSEPWHETPYRRFLILSSPRCGSHMLRTSFAGHPEIVAHTELFNPDWNRNEPFDDTVPAPEVLAKHVFGRYPQSVRAVGFVLHRSGARFGRWPRLWSLLEADRDLHVIRLCRDDLLRRYLSWCLMRERARSGRGDAYVPEPRRIEPDELRREFERAEAELADFDRRFAGHPCLRVSYEHLCRDYAPTLRRIHAFLGARPRAVRPGTRRNDSVETARLLTNWSELLEAFRGSRWAWYFEDGGDDAVPPETLPAEPCRSEEPGP